MLKLFLTTLIVLTLGHTSAYCTVWVATPELLGTEPASFVGCIQAAANGDSIRLLPGWHAGPVQITKNLTLCCDTAAAGGGHVIEVKICYENIEEVARDRGDSTSQYYRCFPVGDAGFLRQFCDSAQIRTAVHEFGHVFGLMHFAPPWNGPGSCAMTYVHSDSFSFLPVCNGPTSWRDFLQMYLYPNHYSYESSPNWPMIFRPRPH